MKRFLFIGFLVATVSCGGDDDDDNGTGGTGGTGGSGGSGGSQNVECDEDGDGACQNPTDCPKVENGEARTASQSCGLGCLQDEDPGTCTVTCIVDDAEISAACATCYAARVGCASENCLNDCAADATSAACAQCQIEAGCADQFDACSGLTTN